jgi:hypothetical protein
MTTSTQWESIHATRPGRSLVGGTFLLFLALYLLSGPGRIDIIDGQYRFEVAWNLVEQGRPIVRDIFLAARSGLDGARYSYYGLPASAAATPLVWLGFVFGGVDGELARFLFSFTSSFFAAASLTLLLHFWTRLGVSPRRAFAWTAIVGLGTLIWPLATSVFDQAQHAFFVLAAVYCGFRSTEGPRSRLWAFISGLCAGVLLLYQIPYMVFAPALALSLLDRGKPSRIKLALPRLFFSALPWSLCLGIWAAYNTARFGSPTDIGALPGHPLLGNPIIGLLDLAVSPGKGIVWYSPIVLLQVWAFPALWRKFRVLALTAGVMGAGHLVFIASMSFHAGDWCWGPRYLVTTLPLISLGLPLLSIPGSRRWAVNSIVVAGIVIQLLGLSMDHQGFFFAHSLRLWFWKEPWANFRRSQLAYRVKEVGDAVGGAKVDMGTPFRPGPYPDLSTYTIFGPPSSVPTDQYPRWMNPYPVFHLPRPWPLWMRHLPGDRRPVPIVPTTLAITGVLVIGALGVRRGLRSVSLPENCGSS